MSKSSIKGEKKAINPILWVWENIEVCLCESIMICLTTITFTNVVLRYGFGNAIPWAEEICGFLIIGLTYGGSAYAFRMGAHIGIEAFISKLPPKGKYIAVILNYLIVIAFFCILTYIGWQYMMQQADNYQLAPVTRIPVAIPMVFIPIGSVMVIARLAYQAYIEIKIGEKEKI